MRGRLRPAMTVTVTVTVTVTLSVSILSRARSGVRFGRFLMNLGRRGSKEVLLLLLLLLLLCFVGYFRGIRAMQRGGSGVSGVVVKAC